MAAYLVCQLLRPGIDSFKAMTASWQVLHHGNWRRHDYQLPHVSQLHHANGVVCLLVGTWLHQ